MFSNDPFSSAAFSAVGSGQAPPASVPITLSTGTGIAAASGKQASITVSVVVAPSVSRALMRFANRLKDTSTTTNTSVITLLGAAPQGFRTLAQAIAAGEIVVGEAGVPFFVDDGAGNWECGSYTITSSTTITRERVVASSNGGQAIVFSAGTKSVYNSIPSSVFMAGLTNPHDLGFDIVLCLGQANMVGQDAAVAALDTSDPRVFMFGSYAAESSSYQKLALAVDPLRHPAQISPGMGPATWFGKTYAASIPSNRKVLLVPVAKSSTALVSGSAEWAVGGTLYETAVTQATAALAEAKKMYPNSRYVGAIWAQGEYDADMGVAQATYVTALKATIAGLRSRINGAANSWFVISGMTAEHVANAGGTYPGYPVIDLAHRQVATETSACAYVQGLSGYELSAANYNVTGARLMGCALGSAVVRARPFVTT